MLIGIDASQAAKDQKTGVENFSFEMTYNLLLFDQNNQYILYSDNPINFPEKFSNAKILVSEGSRFWHNLKLPGMINRTKPDVFISPGYMIPLSSASKMIAIVHDFAYRHFPEAYTQKDKFLQKLSINRAVSKAHAIVALSKNTLKDLNNYYPSYKGIKEVIYQGYNAALFADRKESANYRPVKDRYILSVGRLEQRKNTQNLIKAYGVLRNKFPEITHKLVLSGKKGFKYNEIFHEISVLKKYSDDVIILGYVPDKNLKDLYKNADIFVFPSLYEGFGIPPLESFSVGTPVACSNTSSLPEVGGNAALYFDPLKPEEIADCIHRVLTDNKLRDNLVNESKVQLKYFNWENTSRNMLAVINKVHNEK